MSNTLPLVLSWVMLVLDILLHLQYKSCMFHDSGLVLLCWIVQQFKCFGPVHSDCAIAVEVDITLHDIIC